MPSPRRPVLGPQRAPFRSEQTAKAKIPIGQCTGRIFTFGQWPPTSRPHPPSTPAPHTYTGLAASYHPHLSNQRGREKGAANSVTIGVTAAAAFAVSLYFLSACRPIDLCGEEGVGALCDVCILRLFWEQHTAK